MSTFDTPISRATFLKSASKLALLMGLSRSATGEIANSLEKMATGKEPVIWLQGQSCGGCTISLLNSEPLTIDRFLSKEIGLQFHQSLSAASGDLALESLRDTIDRGNYILVTEGAVPLGMKEACRFGHRFYEDTLREACEAARVVVSVGACASFGGVPAAEGNPTDAGSVWEFMQREGIQKPFIRIPGCPPHPDWMIGTIVHTLRFGIPDLDDEFRPKMFFGKTLHDQCPKFADFENENFAENFGDDGCLFYLGCQGPITHADCTVRNWNGGVNDCIATGAGCIGCTAPHFALQRDFAFYPGAAKNAET